MEATATRLLSAEDFHPHLESDFTVHVGGESLGVRLVEVLLAEHPGPGQRVPFSLTFVGSGKPCLPQSTYELEHAVLGRLAVFLVPLGPKSGEMLYEAVFG